MGLFDDDDELDELLEEEHTNKFEALDLNSLNVQSIFNECFAKSGTPIEKILQSILFSRTRGYSTDVESVLAFDKEKLLANKQNLAYLYGQLRNSHTKNHTLTIEEAFISYSGHNWTSDKGVLLQLLYMGASKGISFIGPFDSKTSSTDLSFYSIKPTLSPKDPNFPAWWEKHKTEWETPKKPEGPETPEGQEPGDD